MGGSGNNNGELAINFVHGDTMPEHFKTVNE